jgi:glycosyltransferase involved in cell wall biosynthesis
MVQPLVSVTVPTYNQVRFVHDAIVSAVEQDYPNLEVVVGDDGSTDGTANVILECARRYPDRITSIVGEPHLGVTRNHNRTLRRCRGKYIAFHAGDDMFLPGKISKQVEWLEADERRVICVHDVELINSEGGRLFIAGGRLAGRGAGMVIRNGSFMGVSVMLRAAALPPDGFDERLLVGSDWKLWIDCLAAGGLYGYVDGVYARYRLHRDSVTKSDMTLRASLYDCLLTLELVEASYPHLAQHCRYGRARVFLDIARWYSSHGDAQNARAFVTSALRKCPEMTVRMLLTSLPAPIRRALSTVFRQIPPSVQGLAQGIL